MCLGRNHIMEVVGGLPSYALAQRLTKTKQFSRMQS